MLKRAIPIALLATWLPTRRAAKVDPIARSKKMNACPAIALTQAGRTSNVEDRMYKKGW